MTKKHNPTPWTFLDSYRGEYFNGEWPSLVELFNITCSRFPERKCWTSILPKKEIFTYAQAKYEVDKFARYLYSVGVRKGDRVALTGKNSPQWAIAYMGILSLSAIVVPTDYSLSDEEIEHLVDFVEIKGLVCDSERFDRIGKDGKYGFKFVLDDNAHSDAYILNLPDAGPQGIRTPSSEDLAAFLFTSGTTGTPKACMLTHKNFVSDALIAQGHMNIDETEVFYAILPIHHAYTMLAVFIESFSVGSEVIFGKRLLINQMFKEMKEGHITMFLAVPMLFNKLLSGIMKGVKEKGKLAEFGINSMAVFSGLIKKITHINIGKKMFAFLRDKVALKDIRICICGGGPLPPATFRKLNEFGIDFVQGYGLTETSPILTLNPIFDYDENSVGKPLAHTEISFSDVDSQGNGEILIKGPMVFKGYYKNEEATDAVIDKDGWFHTGDIGYQNERGFVFLTGRAKNIIVTEGGKNVFPEEIEDHFQLYYDVEQICVLGFLADKEKKVEGICAIIHPSSECMKKYDSKEELQSHIQGIVDEVNKTLLPYKRIRKVFVVDDELEQTATKKIKRFAVQKKYSSLINN